MVIDTDNSIERVGSTSSRIDQTKTGRTCRQRRLTRGFKRAMGIHLGTVFFQDKGYMLGVTKA